MQFQSFALYGNAPVAFKSLFLLIAPERHIVEGKKKHIFLLSEL